MSQWIIGERSNSRRPPPRRISLGEWARMPEDEQGELVDGRLVEEEVASSVHELIVGWLIVVLTAWVDPRGGFVFGSELKYAVLDDRGRKPDASVFLAGSAMPPPEGIVAVPPDLAVEVVSSSPKDVDRDRVEKMAEYAAFGIRWYWIVDPRLRSLEIYERGADGLYARVIDAVEGVVPRVPGFDGLTLDLDGLWRRVDRLVPRPATV